MNVIYNNILRLPQLQLIIILLEYVWRAGCSSSSNSIVISSSKLNVLMIIVDDLRPALNCYGDGKAITPNINKLAKTSFVFTHSYAQQAVCAPSRNSFLTGRRPDTIRLYDFYSYWRHTAGNFTTLPQYLKEFGYETRSVGKVFHPGITSGYTDDYPFSWSNIAYHPDSQLYENKAVCLDAATGLRKKNLICPVDIDLQPMRTLPDIDSMNEAIKILNENRTNPLFLAVGFHKPHIPFRIPAKYFDLHTDTNKFQHPLFNAISYELPTSAFNPYLDIRNRDDAKLLNISFPFGPMPHDFGIGIRQAYYASVTYMDALVGQLLDRVDMNRTLVIFTGDHGWSLGEHADWAKYSNFEVAVRVPLIIYSPEHNLRYSKEISKNVELVDIFPTIVDLVKLPVLPDCVNEFQKVCSEGKSLAPLMNDESPHCGEKDYLAFSQYPRPGLYPTVIPNSDKPRLEEIKIMGYSVRTTQFRYTMWIEFNGRNFQTNWTNLYGEELYDHSFDDAENMNLVDRPQMNAIKRNLQLKLKRKFKY